MADEQSKADELQEGAGAIQENLPERYIGDVVADLNRQINTEQAAGNENLTGERTQELSTAQGVLASYTTTGRLSDEALARAHELVTKQPPPPITRDKPDDQAPGATEPPSSQDSEKPRESTAPLEFPEVPVKPEPEALEAEAPPKPEPAKPAVTPQEAIQVTAAIARTLEPLIPPASSPSATQAIPGQATAPASTTPSAAQHPQSFVHQVAATAWTKIKQAVGLGTTASRTVAPPPSATPTTTPATAAPSRPTPLESPAIPPPARDTERPAQPETPSVTRQQTAAVPQTEIAPVPAREPITLESPAIPPPARDTEPPPRAQQAVPPPTGSAATPQTQAGGDRGQPPPPPRPPVAPPDDDEPLPTWRQSYDERRARGQGRARAATGAAIDSVEWRLADWSVRRQDAAGGDPRVQSADREAIRAGGTTPPQHPLIEAAGRALTADQELARQNEEQFRAAQVSDQGLPPTLQSPEAYYAASKLGYRPGDRRAPSAAARRDRSDDPGRSWEDLGPTTTEQRELAAEELRTTREALASGPNAQIPPAQQALAQQLQRNQDLTAADAFVIQQRQAHGSPAQAVPQRKASWSERMLGIKDEDEDGLRTAKMVAAVEYGEHAIRQYAGAGAKGAEPFIGEAPAAIAGSAGQAVAGIAGGAGTAAAGVATGNPLLVAKGVADVGAELIKLPALIVEWGDALIGSADKIKEFNSTLANAFAVAELRTMQRQFGSAERTGAASANLIDARQDLSDTLQPIKDAATNAISKDIANGIRDLNAIVSILREWGQKLGLLDTDEELANRQTPFQETVAGIKAGGFAAQNEKGEWVQHDLEGGFGGQGMGGLPKGFGRGAAPDAPRTAPPVNNLQLQAQWQQEDLARMARRQAESEKRKAKRPAENNDAQLDFDQETKRIEASQQQQDRELAQRRARQLEDLARPAPARDDGPRPQRDNMVDPAGAPPSPHPAMPGPFRDRRGQQIPKVHAQPAADDKPGFSGTFATGLSLATGGIGTGIYALAKLIQAGRQGDLATDTKPPNQTAGNVP